MNSILDESVFYPLGPILVHVAGAPRCPNVSNYVVKFTGVVVCSPRPAGHSEFCLYLPDSLTEASDWLLPRSPVPPQWQTTSGLPRCDLTTRELATYEKTR